MINQKVAGRRVALPYRRGLLVVRQLRELPEGIGTGIMSSITG